MIGQTLGHYKIQELLGKGGMGEVYRAEDTTLDREVALKILPPELAGNQERLDRFRREAKTLAALDHPNIVHIYTVEEQDGVRFLTMQLVEGKPLSELIPTGGMPLEKIFEIAIPLADALATAHEKGIIHRDLKPANLMVTDKGQVKVLDFGLAKPQHDLHTPVATELPTEPLTEEGRIVGTMPYMSPEQLEGTEIDSRSDVFSLGVILYEMATGDRPFKGDTSISLITAIMRDTPSPVDGSREDLPHHLGRVIRRCLEKVPKNRYQAARDVLNELRDLEDEVGSSSADQPFSPAPTFRQRSTRGRIAATIVAALMVLAGGTYVVYTRSQSSSESGTLEQTVSSRWSQGIDSREAQRLFERGLRYRQRGYSRANLEVAEQCYRQAAALEPDNPFIKGELAALLALFQWEFPQQKRLTEIENLAREALRFDPNLAAPWLARGELHLIAGQADEAIESGRAAQRADPEDYRGDLLVGMALAQKGLVEEALEEIRAGWHKEDAAVTSRLQIAILLAEAGRHDEAIVEYQKTLKIAPGEITAMLNLAAEYTLVGRYADSIPPLKRILELQPDHAGAAGNLGNAHYYLGQMEEAVQAYMLADRLGPELPISAYNLGEAYSKLGEDSLAQDWYQVAADRCSNRIEEGGSSRDLVAVKHLALAKAGRLEEATSGIDQFVETDQEDGGTLFIAASIHAVAGNKDKLLSYMERALRAGYPRQEFLQQPQFQLFQEDAEFLELLSRDFGVS